MPNVGNRGSHFARNDRALERALQHKCLEIQEKNIIRSPMMMYFV